jgi:protoporphyrinogen oxidase
MGAGPAGLTAALEVVRAGREVVVWESDPSYVGGISRSVQADSFRFDVGGIQFTSKVPEVTEFWHSVLPNDMVEFTPSVSVFYRGKTYAFPLESTTAAFNLGVVESARIYSSYLSAKAQAGQDETTFAQWTTNRYGDRLYDSFFKPLVEKWWGVTGDELSAEWAEQNVRVSLGDLLKDAGPRKLAYPRLGAGQMWETAANRILESGSIVQLDRKVATIHWNETGVTHITGTAANGGFFQQEGSHFVCSMPLRDLLLSLDPPPPKEVAAAARALRFRNVITVCVIVNKDKVMPETTMYVNDPSLKVARVLNYKSWSPSFSSNPAMSPVGLDYFCSEGDTLWNATDHDLAQLAVKETVQLGLAKQTEIKDAFVHRMPKAYPLYDLDHAYNLNVIRQWVSLFANLQPVGRSGMHRYVHQDAAMLTALVAVRNIQGESYDCWKVNYKAEYRQKE